VLWRNLLPRHLLLLLLLLLVLTLINSQTPQLPLLLQLRSARGCLQRLELLLLLWRPGSRQWWQHQLRNVLCLRSQPQLVPILVRAVAPWCSIASIFILKLLLLLLLEGLLAS
jgi:hypothetical protein